MHYASPKHERIYKNVTRGRGYPANTSAALYLLTARPKLWKSFCKSVNNQGIDFAVSHNIDVGWDGYYLERAAQSIAKSTAQQITLHDLTDRTECPQELLRLIVTALWIARHDPRATRNIMIQKGRQIIC